VGRTGGRVGSRKMEGQIPEIAMMRGGFEGREGREGNAVG
jgi:hypothetical protein